MSLFAATLSTSLILILLGLILLWNGPVVARAARAFPRSMPAAVVLFGGAAVWFLGLLSNLGPSDFGEYKGYLMLIFGAVGACAFFVARDFLAVRGLMILLLLAARPILDSSLAVYPPPETRVWLNGFVYVAIIFSLYVGCMPYQLRDIFAWLFHKPARPRLFGAVFAVYGIFLTALASTYYNKY